MIRATSFQNTLKRRQKAQVRDARAAEWCQAMFVLQNGHIGAWSLGNCNCSLWYFLDSNSRDIKAFCVHIEFELGEMLKIHKQELVLQRR